MNNKEILKILDKYEAKSAHPQLPVIWEKAIGSKVYGNNKEYIDFTAGIFVCNSGHSSISKYLMHQANSGLIYSYNYPTEIKARFIKKLMEITPNYLEKVALANTGAEAVEIACKLLRLAQVKRSKGKGKIILSIKGAMHGKTFLTAKLGENTSLSSDYFHIPFPTKKSNFLKDIKDLLIEMPLYHYKRIDDVAGIILESYQGWSARFMPRAYVQDIIKVSKYYKIPICFDEIQGGFWRTSKLFAYQHYNYPKDLQDITSKSYLPIKPDLVCVGKGLGGGVPISAVLGKAEILDMADDLTSTFSGNPLSCAGALGNLINLDKIDKDNLKEKSEELKEFLFSLRKDYKSIKEVNSKGLLGAIIFKDTKIATKVCELAEQRGLLVVYTARNSVKIGPPLNINEDSLLEGFYILNQCIKEIK